MPQKTMPRLSAIPITCQAFHFISFQIGNKEPDVVPCQNQTLKHF